MPAVKTRVFTAGLYFKKNELRLEIAHFEALEQTCRLHQLSGSGDKYFFLLARLIKATVVLNFRECSFVLPVTYCIAVEFRVHISEWPRPPFFPQFLHLLFT